MVLGRLLEGNDSCEVHFGRVVELSQVVGCRQAQISVLGPQLVGFLGGEEVCFIFEDGQIDLDLLISELPHECLGRGVLDIQFF
jgi:hypothetical protein